MAVYKKKNPVVEGLSGLLGRTILFKQVNGRTIMVNKARKRKGKLSKKQADQVERFKKAAAYARKVMKDPKVKAAYSSGITPNKSSAHRVAVTDFLNAPVIHQIKTQGYSGKAGELIKIKATDDFRVASVQVEITSKGKVLEHGNAERVKLKPDFWRYRTTKENPSLASTVITVYAKDLPGNETEGVWKVASI